MESFLRDHPDERSTPLERPLDNVNLNINKLIPTLNERLPILKGHISGTKSSRLTRGVPLYSLIDPFSFDLRYDLGGGPVILRSAQKIELKRFHHVVAKRFGQEGRLQLDGGAPITGKSPGQLQSLNVNTPLYLGYIPDASKESVLI